MSLLIVPLALLCGAVGFGFGYNTAYRTMDAPCGSVDVAECEKRCKSWEDLAVLYMLAYVEEVIKHSPAE